MSRSVTDCGGVKIPKMPTLTRPAKATKKKTTKKRK